MPAKYHIHTEPALPRQRVVGKLGIVDWREDCSSCHNCVKRDCVYGFYRDESDTLHEELGYLDYIYQCKGCMMCIQNCTKKILTRVVNPEYKRMGDTYFTPDIILSTLFQSEAGNLPVSGAGYGGPFSGPGFDSMWADMSEIVRPTRDGIHGREYISTSVDIGRKLPRLAFVDGQLDVSPPPLMEIPLPIIFERIPSRFQRGNVAASMVKAAEELGTYMIASASKTPAGVSLDHANVIPLFDTDSAVAGNAALVMLPDSEHVLKHKDSLKEANPNQIVAVRVQASPTATKRAVELAEDGVEVIHLMANAHGREETPSKPRHMRDILRDTHTALVKAGVRDEVTLIASGGIALPEHMAKAIICGADLVAIDLPLMIALECRLCGECKRGEACPIGMADCEETWGARRMTNLMAAWRNQLLEMLGAMGIREVRRLRGETGRAMFFEDLEEATFGRLFGKRKEEYGA